MEGDSPHIVAVNDALIRRNLVVDPLCPLCGQDVETIEHLFLNCCFARRVCGEPLTWALIFPRGHRLDFLTGGCVSIWCARNDALFKSIKVDVDRAFAMFFRVYMQVHS